MSAGAKKMQRLLAVLAGSAVLGVGWLGRTSDREEERGLASQIAAGQSGILAPPDSSVSRTDTVLTSSVASARRAQRQETRHIGSPGDHPHPLTGEHLRLYRDRELLADASDALKRRDFASARTLLETHVAEYDSGSDDMHRGLSLLLECMELPSSESRARAQHFYDSETQSMVRRPIRRWCLEEVR